MALEAQTPDELQNLLLARQNPIRVALQGPIYGVEDFQAGHLFASQLQLFKLVAAAIMNIFLVMRHTRGDEEKGRYEVIRSLPVGRLAMPHAAMIVALCVNGLLAISQGLLLWALGVGGIDMMGAFTYGAMLGATGLFFAALAAFFAQLSHSARDATSYAFLFLVGSYLVRAVGDQASETLSLISPFGLVMRAEVFVQNRWWPIFTLLVLALIICILAYTLNARRDMEQGLLPQRRGKAYASPFLCSPAGLAWCLNRNTLISWAVGMFAFGAALGGLLGEAEVFGESDAFRMMMPQSPDFSATELFTMLINVILIIICIAPALILLFKHLGEEKEQRTEQILSGAVSRRNYLAGYVTISFIASVVMPLLTTLGLWLVGSFMMEIPITFGRMFLAIMVYVPALWVVIGLGVLIIGLLPKAAILCWAYFAYLFVVGFFGDLLNVPQWATRLSPIGFIPRLPLDEVHVITLLILTAVAACLTTSGFIFYRRRDIMA